MHQKGSQLFYSLLKNGKKGSFLRLQHASCKDTRTSFSLRLSTSLLPQMANNLLTVEGATELVGSVRKNPNSMMEEINISVRAYVPENFKAHTAHIFRNQLNLRAVPLKTVLRLAVCFIYAQPLFKKKKKKLPFCSPCRSHKEIMDFWSISGEICL